MEASTLLLGLQRSGAEALADGVARLEPDARVAALIGSLRVLSSSSRPGFEEGARSAFRPLPPGVTLGGSHKREQQEAGFLTPHIQIVTALLEADLAATDESLTELVTQLGELGPSRLPGQWMQPVSTRLSALLAGRSLSARCRRAFQIAIERLEPEEPSFNTWSSVLYGALHRSLDPPLSGEWWSAVVLATVEHSDAWRALLRHAAKSGTKATASARWQRVATALMDAINEPNPEERIHRWIVAARYGAHRSKTSNWSERRFGVHRPSVDRYCATWIALEEELHGSSLGIALPPLAQDVPSDEWVREIPRANHDADDEKVLIGLIRLVRDPGALRRLQVVVQLALKKAPEIGLPAPAVARVAACQIASLGVPEGLEWLEQHRDELTGSVRTIFVEALAVAGR